MSGQLPVAVIGAGPVGLAAAAHLLERGLAPLVLEAGPAAGSAVRTWGHVRLFSPWRYLVDAAALRLLRAEGWRMPDPEALPTGAELLRDYLEPLAATAALRGRLRYGTRVTAVGRQGTDKTRDAGREARPFVLYTDADGRPGRLSAAAVLDASGTWGQPNPLGADGLPLAGEAAFAGQIAYGIPDVLGAARADHAGRTVLVAGSGHSAMNAVLDLLRLQAEAPATRLVWAMRRAPDADLFGGGGRDGLPARGELGQRARIALDGGLIRLLAPFPIDRVEAAAGGRLRLSGDLEGGRESIEVDRVIVATGARPDLQMLREVRLDLDPALECPATLGPLIDPNLHSCGTVRPHGARELAQPEAGFYIVGMKSYGRAPTFLTATGYEQVRSIAAALAGDAAAAARVELQLPETGVCGVPASRSAAPAACCG